MRNIQLFYIILVSIFSVIISIEILLADTISEFDKLVDQYKFNKSSQVFCLSKNQFEIQSNNPHKKIAPASISKLYVGLWAIEKLGHDFRFTTNIYYKDENLYIKGDNDPYLVFENIIHLLSTLNDSSIYKIKSLYFGPDFYLNWSNDFLTIKNNLLKIFNTRFWPKEYHKKFIQTKKTIKRLNLPIDLHKPQMTLLNVKLLKTNTHEYKNAQHLKMLSSPLYQHLKIMNCFSNNFYYDQLFSMLGGPIKFSKYIYKKFNKDNKTIYFETGSGLGKNYTTCELTIEILKSLKKQLSNHNLRPSHLFPVPNNDPGTLNKRFLSTDYKNTIYAKTGTLKRLSALSGILFDPTGNTYFGIFNSKVNVSKAKRFQEIFIRSIYFPVQSFDYTYNGHSSLDKAEIIPMTF